MAKVKADVQGGAQVDDENIDFPGDAEEGEGSTGALALRDTGAIGVLTGAVSAKDIPMPILALVYGVGELSENFTPGDLVLDKEHMLVHKLEPLNVIVVQAHVYFKEYLDQAAYASGLRPRSFNSLEEVKAVGGTTEYDEAGPGSKPNFKRAMLLKMLIEKPEKLDCMLFATNLFGKKYAPARWYVDKTAYERKGGKGVGVEIVKQAGFALQERGLLAGKWQVTTAFVDMGANKVPCPSIKLIGQYTDEEIAEIKAAIGM